jgi:hypothetical protein
MQHDDERPNPAEKPDEAPDIPGDEPKPAPVQDPPAEPDRVHYVVQGHQRLTSRESNHD